MNFHKQVERKGRDFLYPWYQFLYWQHSWVGQVIRLGEEDNHGERQHDREHHEQHPLQVGRVHIKATEYLKMRGGKLEQPGDYEEKSANERVSTHLMKIPNIVNRSSTLYTPGRHDSGG